MHPPMTEWSFTLLFAGRALSDEAGDMFADAFYGRCDDALVSSRDGVLRVGFDRPAPSLREAVRSALADVAAVLPDAKLCGIEQEAGELAALVE